MFKFPLTPTLLSCCFLSMSHASAATIHASTAYYVSETLDTIVSSASSSGTVVSSSGSFNAPTGTTMSGLAGFDNGRFFGSSTLTRGGAFGFNEGFTASSNFRDTLTINSGACPIGGSACQLVFSYTATGSFSATGSPSFAAGQLDFAVLNPVTPGIRSTWLVDHPVFLTAGSNLSITDTASVVFFDNQPFVFWPVFGVVARQVAGSNGQSTLDFSHSLLLTSFSVQAPGGSIVPFTASADSGLIYSNSGLSAVPEPGTAWLALGALALIGFHRRTLVRRE